MRRTRGRALAHAHAHAHTHAHTCSHVCSLLLPCLALLPYLCHWTPFVLAVLPVLVKPPPQGRARAPFWQPAKTAGQAKQACWSGRRGQPMWTAAAGSRCCSLLRRAARRPLIRAIASGLGARPTPARRLRTMGARAGSYAAVASQPSRARSIGCLARKRNSERRSEQRSGARDIGRSTVH